MPTARSTPSGADPRSSPPRRLRRRTTTAPPAAPAMTPQQTAAQTTRPHHWPRRDQRTLPTARPQAAPATPPAEPRRGRPPLRRTAPRRSPPSAARRLPLQPRSSQHRHLAGVTVDTHPCAVRDPRRRVAGADDTGDAVLARDDGRVRQRAAAVGDDAGEQRQQDVERLGRRLGDQYVALLDPVEVGRALDPASRSFAASRAPREATDD